MSLWVLTIGGLMIIEIRMNDKPVLINGNNNPES
ncbi:hypothetical protein CAL7102_03077 [Dulcicalothrix desertica PCC 7102]|nr:hypothetical protein CAL7102_03077 [Dulcicalothrix desertica PCC 7102]